MVYMLIVLLFFLAHDKTCEDIPRILEGESDTDVI
jgi:hypothetical protein